MVDTLHLLKLHTRIIEQSLVRILGKGKGNQRVLSAVVEQNGCSAEIVEFCAFEQVSTETNDPCNWFLALKAIVEGHGTALTKTSNIDAMVWEHLGFIRVLRAPVFDFALDLLINNIVALLNFLHVILIFISARNLVEGLDIVPTIEWYAVIDCYWPVWCLQ